MMSFLVILTLFSTLEGLYFVIVAVHVYPRINPCFAEAGYILSLQTVLLKPTDLDLHYLPLSLFEAN